MKIKPTGNRVLAELIQDNPVSTGGIALPTNYVPVGPRKIRMGIIPQTNHSKPIRDFVLQERGAL